MKNFIYFFLLLFIVSCNKGDKNSNNVNQNSTVKDSVKNSTGNNRKVIETTFVCGDKEFTVKHAEDKVLITIDINGTIYTEHELPIAKETSGAKYTDGKLTFWQKGNRCIVQLDGSNVYEDCMEKTK